MCERGHTAGLSISELYLGAMFMYNISGKSVKNVEKMCECDFSENLLFCLEQLNVTITFTEGPTVMEFNFLFWVTTICMHTLWPNGGPDSIVSQVQQTTVCQQHILKSQTTLYKLITGSWVFHP